MTSFRHDVLLHTRLHDIKRELTIFLMFILDSRQGENLMEHLERVYVTHILYTNIVFTFLIVIIF